MAERRGAETRANRASVDEYIRDVPSGGGPADEIATAKGLLDSGAINEAEFQQIKHTALA